jgi:hypothetical protein
VELRPSRGGFLRPFGCAWFIREYLLGHGPEGAPVIDPERGAPQSEINYQYKSALVRAFARDSAERIIEQLEKGGHGVSPERAEEIYQEELKKIPHKYTRMRYHSFLVYFGLLKRLEWVGETGESRRSALQENYPPGPAAKYYRLTAKGRRATLAEWSNPLFTLYPEIAMKYRG